MSIERLPPAERYRFLCDACRDPAYCCNHIAIEDGNLDDSCVEFCVNEAKEKHHLDCLELAEFLLSSGMRSLGTSIDFLGTGAPRGAQRV